MRIWGPFLRWKPWRRSHCWWGEVWTYFLLRIFPRDKCECNYSETKMSPGPGIDASVLSCSHKEWGRAKIIHKGFPRLCPRCSFPGECSQPLPLPGLSFPLCPQDKTFLNAFCHLAGEKRQRKQNGNHSSFSLMLMQFPFLLLSAFPGSNSAAGALINMVKITEIWGAAFPLRRPALSTSEESH